MVDVPDESPIEQLFYTALRIESKWQRESRQCRRSGKNGEGG